MYCGHVCLVGFATRLLVANFGAVFRWDLSGASRMAKCDSIQMKPYAPPFAPCLLALLNSDRRVASGCGSAASVCPFLYRSRYGSTIRWVEPSYIAIYHVLDKSGLCRRLCVWQEPP